MGQYAASLLGNIGETTVAGVETYGDNGANAALPVGSSIVGPFEAGFTSTQDMILRQLGCATGKGYLDGGIDTNLAERMVAHDCGVTLPRWEGTKYVSLLGTCGGHTKAYHFHERFSCLYEAKGGHSTQVGKGYDGKFLYGMWEHTENKELPQLDACGGHWGPTPDSDKETYHYHVQAKAPFTIGCYGPNPDNSLVTVEQCRALYSTCDGSLADLVTSEGTTKYDLFCPCFDANGSNTGVDIVPLPVFSTEKAAGPGGQSVLQKPTTSSSTGSFSIVGSSSKGGKKTKKTRKTGSFRVTVNDDSCKPQLFEIRSRTGHCLDASKKKAVFAPCTNTHEQRFSVQDGHIMLYATMNGHVAEHLGDSMCLSPTLTFGPCSQPNSVTKVGSNNFQVKLPTGKCVAAVQTSAKAVECLPNAKPQLFNFVPVF